MYSIMRQGIEWGSTAISIRKAHLASYFRNFGGVRIRSRAVANVLGFQVGKSVAPINNDKTNVLKSLLIDKGIIRP